MGEILEIREWIMISSATIIVVGWFVNGVLNRRHEIAKKRLEYRLETLHSFLPVTFSIDKYDNPFEDDPELLKKLEKARTNFQLYGKKDEIEKLEIMITAIDSRDIPTFISSCTSLTELVRIRIRSELGLNT